MAGAAFLPYAQGYFAGSAVMMAFEQIEARGTAHGSSFDGGDFHGVGYDAGGGGGGFGGGNG